MITSPDIDRNDRLGTSRSVAAARRWLNAVRTWYWFRVRRPWMTRHGFVRLPLSVSVTAPNRRVSFGHRVQLGPRCTIQTDVSFGDSVLVAGEVAFLGRHDHRIDVVGATVWGSGRGETSGIIVEDDVWIGWRAIILDGVTIGRGAVVGAGSVVTKAVSPYTVVAGVPAREIAKRFTGEEARRHEDILGMRGAPRRTALGS